MRFMNEMVVMFTVFAMGCGGSGGGTVTDTRGGDINALDATGPDTAGPDGLTVDPGAPETMMADTISDVGGGFESVKSALDRVKAPGVPDADMKALAEGNAAFALDLYKTLAAEKGNLFLAPASVSIALAQTFAGAKGKTADEIAQALHFTLPQETLHPTFNALDQTLESRGAEVVETGEPFKLSVVNALWGQKGYPFVNAYLDLLALNYGAGMNLLDFAANPDAARKVINDWVAEQTFDRIKDLLGPGTVDELTRLVITNAIYFKAGWRFMFDPEQTHAVDFHRLDGTTCAVKQMEMEEPEYLNHATTDAYEAVALPYVGEKVAMVVILPAPGKFAEVEASLDGPKFLALLDAMQFENGRVALPRFGMEYKASLADALAKLGMETAFSFQADFTGISPTGEIYISDVIHQTFLKVDEEGTEAAGATAVVFEGTGMPPKPFYMVVDRPFLFAIVDLPTRAILFLGRTVDPS